MLEELLSVFLLFSHSVEAVEADPPAVSEGDVGLERLDIAIIALAAFCCCLRFFSC